MQSSPVGTRERCRIDNIVARVDVGDEEVASALAAALSLVRASVQRRQRERVERRAGAGVVRGLSDLEWSALAAAWRCYEIETLCTPHAAVASVAQTVDDGLGDVLCGSSYKNQQKES